MANFIKPYNDDPFVGHLATPITSSSLTRALLKNLPAYRFGLTPLLRGLEIGLAHGYFLIGPFAQLGPLRNSDFGLLAGFLSTIGLILILTLGLTIYGTAAFGNEKSQGNTFQTKKSWDQFKGGFFVGACGSAGFAFICLSSIPIILFYLLLLSNMNSINLQEEYTKTEIEKLLNLLDEELVGLAPVKARIREIAALLLIDKLRKNLGITTNSPGLHMSFTGSPGTGKTTVGLKMADILFQLGYVKKGHLLTVTRDDLVGQYIGHTAPKTKEVLKKAMGGVLFIDEAYYLYKPDNERDYGSEAIEILLQVMENQRDELVVILAGYKEPMDKFYESNPGLSSRIANHIDFPDYTVEELSIIAKMMLEEQQYQLTPQAEVALHDYISRRKQKPLFANARSIKNALDRARMRQANRIFDSRGQILTKKELVNIEADDILQSTIFN
jgi:probable Rubsico expression protein CbbX